MKRLIAAAAAVLGLGSLVVAGRVDDGSL